MTANCRSYSILRRITILTAIAVMLLTIPLSPPSADDVIYVYDSLNRLIEVRYPDKIIVYTYDAAGNRSSLVIANPNPVPVLGNLNPNSAVVGGAGFNLIVTGTNFLNDSTLQWKGTPRTTSFDSPTQLTASINAADIAMIGIASVTVINPAPGGGTSNELIFNITPPCSYSAFPASQSFAASGGADIVTVVSPNGCNWTAVSNDAWIIINSGNNGSGNGTVNYSVAANTGIGRSGTMTVAGQTVTITQAPGCSLSLNSNGHSFPVAGGNSTVNVTAGTGCDWQAQSNSSFITVTSGANGVSNGTISYTVAANTGPARSGTMTIAGQIFTVMQDAGCSFMLNSTNQNFVAAGGMNSVNVTTSAGCDWTAVSNDGLVTINSGTPGSGNGTVNYSIAANTGPARTGTMTIAAQTFTVTQDSGCSFMLSSTSQNFAAAGGMNSVNVITATGCSWAAVSNDAFTTVTAGSTGSGNGPVSYSVIANTGPARMGTMTIAGRAFSVTQDSGCTFTLDRDHQSFPGSGGTATVNVTTLDSACDWTANTAATFIHVTSGMAGIGNGAVQYSVDANAGSSIRSGTITIAGRTYTVYQGIDFVDVPSNHDFYTEIGKLSARGVTLGCNPNGPLYCPNDPVLREQMAAFIMRALGEFGPPPPASQRFGDVPPDNQFYNFIERLAQLGITLGCQPGNPPLYCPSDPVKREQMSAFILRALGEFNPPTPANQRFGDVPPSNDFYNFIDRLAVLGITFGCQPGNPPLFCPNSNVNRGQMAAFLVRAFDL